MPRRSITGALVAVLGGLVIGVGTAAAADREPRIVGGAPTTVQQYPWQVALAQSQAVQPGEQSGFERQFCGGTLVAPTIVITAAHCIDLDGSGDFNFPPGDFAVFTGRTNLSSNEGQEIAVADLYWFDAGAGGPEVESFNNSVDVGDELYNPDTSVWDAAFLRLSQPSSTGTPIKIAGPGEEATWAAGAPGLISGWGALSEGGSFPEQLHAAQVRLVSDADCITGYSGTGVMVFPATMVCAGFFPQGGIDTCQGDSGGPLVVPVFQKSKGGRAVNAVRLVGDTSFGIGCARANFMGVYGRLASDPMRSAFRSAIQQVAGVDVVGSGAEMPESDPPQTTLTKKPKKTIKTKKKKVKVTFKFGSDEESTFECKRDDKAFRSCSSPYKAFFKKGKHMFQVRATDDQGNSDGSAAKVKFRVKRA